MKITHKTPKAELKRVMEEFADSIIEFAPDSKKNDFCRILMHIGAAPLLKELARLFSMPLEDIKRDRKTLFMILNARYFVESLSIIVRRLGMINDNVLLINQYTATRPAAEYPHLIHADLYAFYMWILLHGGSGADIRREIDSKTAACLSKTEKQYGEYSFPTLLIRAEIAIRAISNHVLLPACRPHLEGKDETKVNTMANAFKDLKK